jgi:hypothetical protein
MSVHTTVKIFTITILSKLKAFTIRVISKYHANTVAICYLLCTKSKMVPTIYTVSDINLAISTIYTILSLKSWCHLVIPTIPTLLICFSFSSFAKLKNHSAIYTVPIYTSFIYLLAINFQTNEAEYSAQNFKY